MKLTLSIVATIYNKDRESITTFLEALKRQTSKSFELVLVDDCSSLMSYAKVVNSFNRHFKITYIRFGVNKGQCVARNVGIRESRGDIVCIVDSDCIPNPHFVEYHIKEQMDHDVRDVLIGPYNMESNGRNIWQLLDSYERNPKQLAKDMGLQYPKDPAYFLNFITRNVSIKRRALPKDLFDLNFGYVGSRPNSGFGWEDVEAGYSLFRAGLNFGFTRKAFTVHLSHPATTDPAIKPLRSLRNFSRLLNKHPHMLHTKAAPWVVETYGRIFDWFVGTRGDIQRPAFKDRGAQWGNVVLTLTRENERTHPMVIESVLGQWQPGMWIHLVTKPGYDSPIAEYHAKQHSYVSVVKSNSTANVLKGLGKQTTFCLTDDQVMPPDVFVDARAKKSTSVTRQGAPPLLGGFQAPGSRYYHNIGPVLRGQGPKKPKRRLKILTYRWHCGHQYELYKLPHDFYLVEDDTTMGWDYDARPLHSNVKFVPLVEVDPRKFDVAILHFDENCLNPSISNGVLGQDWGAIFRKFLELTSDMPRVGVCHGTPPFHGMFDVHYTGRDLMKEWTEEANRIRTAIGDMPVVCNSWNAWSQWRFPNSRVIWHGFNSDEYSIGKRTGGPIYVANSIRHRPWYRGYYEFKYLHDQMHIAYLGRDDLKEFRGIRVPAPPKSRDMNAYARNKFQNYQATVGRYSVFVNTTLRSPMPRSRTEAMLKGLALVTMDFHDEGMFITHGVNGFLGKTKKQLEAHLKWLQNHPEQTRRIGMRGRETVRRVFPLSRYHHEWQENLVGVLGGTS